MQLEYLIWNKKGLIPGPNEEEAAYQERIEKVKALKKQDIQDIDVLKKAMKKTKKLFDIYPDWMPLLFESQGLTFWEGGATWISQDQLPIIRLKASLKKKSVGFGLYSAEEILAHEFAHGARILFNDSYFEEFFAYQTSKKKYRVFLGTLLQRPQEVYLFLVSLWIYCIALFWGHVFFILMPICLILYAMIRSVFLFYSYRNACRKLRTFLKDKQNIKPVVFRLTDKEIIFFSKSSMEEINKYIESQHSFRWDLIKAAYF